MGLANIPSAADGTPIPSSDHNALAAALKGDLVPRNSSGNATEDAGQLGTPTFPWKRADITTGYLFCGQVIMFHDYNGLLTPGQGWMKMNGDIVNEANYDAIHGAGSWDDYIGTSPLDGKYLPNAADKYPMGKANTTQAGTVAITFVGNASHQINIQHSHTVASHTHTMAHTHTWPSGGGNTRALTDGTESVSTSGSSTANTGAAAPGTDSQLSTTQNIQPHTLELEFWMRII